MAGDEDELLDLNDDPEIAEEAPEEPVIEAVAEEAAPKVRKSRAPKVATADAVEEVRLHDILTNEEVYAAQAKARDLLDRERRKNAMKAVQDKETERLRREEGMVTGDGAKDEIVKITLDLAPHSPCLTTNGVAFWHGQTYDVPRHVADDLRSRQYMGWKHQDEVDGKDMTQHYQNARKTVLNAVTGAAKRAPTSFAAEEIRH